MPDFFIYSNADLGIAPGLNGATDVILNGAATTVSGSPDIASVSDDDANFDDLVGDLGQIQDPGLNQSLEQDLVIDGVTIGTAGDPIYNEAASTVTNNTTGETGTLYYVTLNDGAGNQTWVGFASTILLNPGDDITISTGDPVASVPYTDLVLCFGQGTLIEAANGPMPVENLQVGGVVKTLDHGLQKIQWIGHRTVQATGNLAPIVFLPGAIGNDRELILSPQHRVLVSGWRAELFFGEPEVLVPAKHLAGSDQIYRREGGTVEYFHILFDRHEIVFSNGALSESFHPGETGLSAVEEAQREELFSIFPELAASVDSFGPSARPSLKRYEASLLV
ncbi:Hint domain-containing protein [Aestuariibius sp. 2305UL40-4]|uniref:Hint domain-containing protein n=1 Tax=Aestuariibius violaceus TaxID=3234132 RepID=UPI00345E859E